MTNNKTDYIMSSDRKIIGNCEVITKVDIGSEPQNGQSKSGDETKENLKTKPFKLDLTALEKLVTPYLEQN